VPTSADWLIVGDVDGSRLDDDDDVGTSLSDGVGLSMGADDDNGGPLDVTEALSLGLADTTKALTRNKYMGESTRNACLSDRWTKFPSDPCMGK
jgi:hypothetical protein